MLCLWKQRCRTSTPTSSCTDSHIIAGIHRPHARRRDECSSSNATTRSPASCALPIPGKQPRRLDADWRLFLGELSSATSGSLTVALCAAAAELRGTGLLVRHEREQAPTASSGTAACPGVATLLLNARSRRAGCLLASTSGAPGGCSGVALAMRPMLVARCRRPVSSAERDSGCRLAVKRCALGPAGRPSGDSGTEHPPGGG